jgi:endo-1,4-beta-mannosidase
MNEPRSQAELYITQRKTTDGSKIYNISYNPADDLQTWIEDMAAYIKSIDPIHLLSTGAHLALLFKMAFRKHTIEQARAMSEHAGSFTALLKA